MPKAPFDTCPNSLMVAYAADAELSCFLALGWPFPAIHWILQPAIGGTDRPLDEGEPFLHQLRRDAGREHAGNAAQNCAIAG
jgi:hypothetical protein